MPKILIVDDEKIILLLLKKTLESMGFSVAGEATSGEESVRKTLDLNPDLILMDINMPGELDGIDAAKAIQEKKPTPLIFLTAYSKSMYEKRLQEVQYRGYLNKPFDFEELKTCIEESLN